MLASAAPSYAGGGARQVGLEPAAIAEREQTGAAAFSISATV